MLLIRPYMPLQEFSKGAFPGEDASRNQDQKRRIDSFLTVELSLSSYVLLQLSNIVLFKNVSLIFGKIIEF